MATTKSCVAGLTRSRRPRRLVEADVADIVHDIRNPLGAIALETILLDESFGDADREAASRSVRRIQHNIDYLDRLLSDLFDACAIATGEFQLHRTRIELHTLLERVIDRLAPAARLRVKLEAALAPALQLDDVRIQRVVANLLDNAVKYAPPETAIDVKLDADTCCVYVSVIDAGGGVSTVDVPHLFERYRRAADVQVPGHGIGLYTCKKIIEAHGGTIGVDTVRGNGSRFFFALPIC